MTTQGMVTDIRVSRTVLGWFEGTGAWIEQDGHDEESSVMMRQIRTTGRRKDGSVVLDLPGDLADVLYEYAGYLEAAAADGASAGEMDSMGELNAARALQRQLVKKGVKP